MEKIVKIYDKENYIKLLDGIKVIHINKIADAPSTNVAPISGVEDLNISDALTCSYCKISFDDNAMQRQHYKSDWHRYNLKQNLKTLEPISEEKFVTLADDVSSISGSDSDSDDSPDRDNKAYAVSQGKIFFQNSEGIVFSMYRSLLHEKKDAPACDEAIVKIARQCIKISFWTILMLGGGHFAAAVYNGSDVLVHKTFHRYTVRAKQGGAQSTHKGGAKSAGSNLRKYNELSLSQIIGELLQTWAPYIEKSTIIFYRAAGTYNRTVLFGGKNPILKKNDTRLRNIPFSTRRPTYTELQRVQDVLSSVEVYSSFESIRSQFTIQKETEDSNVIHQSRRESPKNKNINRAKSRETKERPLPGAEDENSSSSNSENEQEYSLDTQDTEMSFSDLKQYDDTVPEDVRKRKMAKKKKPKKKDRVKKWEDNLKKDLYAACTKGELETLKNIFVGLKESQNENEENENTHVKTINMIVDEHGNTMLHLAALNSQTDMIIWLMENNASPCNKNDKFHTPYTINADKTIRNVFRTFAAENPDKYNYAKSQIPVIVSTMTEEELAEKRKIQRKAKREREKEKRKENDVKRKEEEDKLRYLKLSDREKRALAAERRILAQTSAVLVRCFLCGEDISGKVPFEYSGNRFCSIACLKAHRMQSPAVLS